jgi:NADH:ubiquinone oxidoreductase subunit 4 (subunit M)
MPLIACAFWIGIYPKPFFDILDKPVASIVTRVNGPTAPAVAVTTPAPHGESVR